MKILVTGATGYIGGRLIPILLEKEHAVRVLARDARRLEGREWFGKVEIVEGDLENREEIARAANGVDAAYFLVHSMNEGGDFVEREKHIAENFARMTADVKKIIYLGGLQPQGENTSEHLSSRAAVGEILRETGNTTEFRAGPIIGSGSASFEMVRYLTERIPVMVVPKWVKNAVQPIAVRNVLQYLIAALDKEPLGVVDIGADVLPFRQMMQGFAEVRGLRRIIVPVPVLTPLLSGLWVGLITPIPNSLAVPLVKGIINPVLADTTEAVENFPEIELIPYKKSVELALRKIVNGDVETRWSDSVGEDENYRLTDKEGLIKEVRTVLTDASPSAVYRSFTGIGGEKGWLAWNWAWKLRGLMDKFVGGPGLSRGRRHPTELKIGEELDFWRVEDLRKNESMLLRAEMKMPGKAWLQFEAIPQGKQTKLVQTALYAPKGLLGALYWYALFPAHLFLFSEMANNVAKAAESFEIDNSKMSETI